jgi:hypothetical protein
MGFMYNKPTTFLVSDDDNNNNDHRFFNGRQDGTRQCVLVRRSAYNRPLWVPL